MPKVHPALTALIGTQPGSTPVDVFVTFADTESIPPFPSMHPTRPRGDLQNQARVDSAAAMIDTLRSHRTARYAQDSLTVTAHGAILRETFWLIQAMVITCPLDSVVPISNLPGVIQVRPVAGEPAPSHDSERSNDMDEARERLGSDHYLEMGLFGGYLALLDTGVRTRHRLLKQPTPLALVVDCITNQSTNMATTYWYGTTEPPGGGDTYTEGHGTASASILVGNGRAIPSTMPESQGWFQGVTRAELDCFQVYQPNRLVSAPATVRGFERAIARLNDVIVAEMADASAEMADVATAADKAFEAGRVVIAPNGNYQSYGTGIPARGRRVIGVGAYHLQFNQYVGGQAYGSTGDGRIKPDLVTPSYTETASNAGDEGLFYFTGTSGAAPYAGGAAMLLRNWMVVDNSNVDPGQVYSFMILAGVNNGVFPPDSRQGVGLIHLPDAGKSLYGKTWVSDGTATVDIPIDVPDDPNPQWIRAALWWPEPPVLNGNNPVDTHNDIDLSIVSPGWFGSVMANSTGSDGVFERTEYQVPAHQGGKWILRIHAYQMRTAYQAVYWSASLGD